MLLVLHLLVVLFLLELTPVTYVESSEQVNVQGAEVPVFKMPQDMLELSQAESSGHGVGVVDLAYGVMNVHLF